MKSLIKKLKPMLLNRETILYLVFGISTTVVDYAAYYLLRLADINYIIANCIAWCLAVVFAFVTNKFLVFGKTDKDRKTLAHEILSFLGARIFSLGFSIVFMFFSVSMLGMQDMIAKIISSVFVVIINYFFSKFYIFRAQEETAEKNTSFFKDNLLYILAFIIPVLALCILYIVRDIYPFGDRMYLRSDCYHQYAPFHKELWRKITTGEGLTYSWNIGLGVNFTALYAYYLASPVNWLLGLVVESHIIEWMNAFIIIKLGLCSLTFSYYLSKKFDTKRLSMAAFSIFYALSSYVCAFSWNVMWLDCLLLFPLVMLGLEKLVKENKCYLYCISLGFCILSNYYIAIMICMFSVLYFIVYTLVNAKRSLRYYIQRILNFAIYSLLAGGFAAFLFVPAFLALSQTASGDFNFPTSLSRYFSVFQMLSRSVMNVSPAMFTKDPNIYCTIAIFLLLPIYWTSQKIDIKEKIGKTLLLAVLLFSFNLNIPNYIWHGFHFPNALPCRESFIYIFLILAMSYEGFLHIKEASHKQLFGAYGVSVGLLLHFEQVFVDDSYSYKSIYLSILFLSLYLFVMLLFRCKASWCYVLAVCFLFALTFGEAYTNLGTGFRTTSRTTYLQDNDNIDEILAKVNEEDKGFFRIEKQEYERRSKNDAAWHGYRGASIFSSTTIAPLADLYQRLGMEKLTNSYAYYGHTPLIEAIFSIKYVLHKNQLEDTNLIQLYTSSTDDDSSIYLYENKYVLPLGFMVDASLNELIDTETKNPFAVQNSLFNALGGEGELFGRLAVETVDTNNTIKEDFDMHLYVYSATAANTINVEITDPQGEVIKKSFGSMNYKWIMDIGYVKKGSTVSVVSGDSEKPNIQIYAYAFHEDVFTSLIDKLNQNGMELTSMEDSKLTGTITADQDGLMFTSIPYDKGWTVYVDDEKVEPEAFQEALLMIPVTAGTHTIRMTYTPQGLYLGIILSLLSVIAFVAIVVCNKRIKKENVKR